MKKLILLILSMALLAVSGCSNLNSKVSMDSKPVEEPIENPVNQQSGNLNIDEYSIGIDKKTITLKDWDNQIDLYDILGEPISQKVERLGPGSDTFQGSFVKELKYQGLKLKLFSPKDNGQTFYIIRMEITDSKYLTVRDIKVGDEVEKLMMAYPELSNVPDGRSDPKNCAYQYLREAFNYIVFEVKNGKIEEISIYHEFP